MERHQRRYLARHGEVTAGSTAHPIPAGSSCLFPAEFLSGGMRLMGGQGLGAHVFDEDNGLWFPCSDSGPGTGEAGGAHTLEARLFCSLNWRGVA